MITFVGFVIGWTVWITKNVPQTSYIDELFDKQAKLIELKHVEQKNYTDERLLSVKAEAFAHSDLNKSGMESQYQGLSAKIDMLILMVRHQKR